MCIVRTYANLKTLELTKLQARLFTISLTDFGQATEIVELERGNGHRVISDDKAVDFLTDEINAPVAATAEN